MKIIVFLLFSTAVLGQKNQYEAKWESRGNGGGDYFLALNQPINQSQACLYGPIKITEGWTILSGGYICFKGGHGSLHIVNFGSCPFFVDDEGYIFLSPIYPENKRVIVRDFANGIH